MSRTKRANSLEITQDLEFQHRCWRVQRVGWLVIAGLVLAGLLGGFGRGWLSNNLLEAGDGLLAVEYERVARVQATSRLRVHIRSRESDAIRLWIGRDYLDFFEVQRITPEPAEVTLDSDRFVYVFSGGERPVTVVLDLDPRHAGVRVGQLGVGERSLAFTQWILP